MQIGHYSCDQSGKGMQIHCILKTYQGKEHVGHVVPLEVFIWVSAFYFTFFFFIVHCIWGRLVVTSSTHHFIPVSPYSNCLTLAKKLLFLRTCNVMPSAVINAGSSGIVWFGHIGVVIEQLPFPPGSTGII